MFRKILLLSSLATAGILSAQWKQASPPVKKVDKNADFIKKKYFTLDLDALRSQLSKAQEQGPNSQPVMIQMPTSGEKVETFQVYSFPVVVKSLADRYQLGSYIGVSTENPAKMVRFSVAPNDFQAMIYGVGEYQFIDPEDKTSALYSLHAKSGTANGKAFTCSTEEGSTAADIQKLQQNNILGNMPGSFSRNSDSKYRTMRLALSVTAEYTQSFGGVAGALAQMNATMTRVNGVFEKDFALHLNMLDYPSLIYTDPATDPYDTVNGSYPASWNQSLQTTLTNVVGNANYDIGHLFGASGGGGNAGCIGCVCVDPTAAVPKGKGSGITSPAGGLASGDNFDIDYVAHEMGHQLGANHTFSHNTERSTVNMEPGSGSTIMGYAGITGSNTDVQAHSDAYFHFASINQVQNNLIAKTCDVETPVANTPPSITPFTTLTIPKGTAFYLTGNATDAEGDPMTFNWEQADNISGSTPISKANLGTTTSGATFRSVPPSNSMVRYFPKFSTVMNGTVRDVNGWESVSLVPRTTNFRFVVRDNSAAAASPLSQQQTNWANQTVIVSNDGPFQVTGNFVDTGANGVITWDVANTSAAAYNSPNVKIDYTTDNGATWTVLQASTPNDGTEAVTLPSSLNGQNIKVRVSAIGNVFYAVKQLQAVQFGTCNGTAPMSPTVSTTTQDTANLVWPPVVNAASYSIQYKPVNSTNWLTVTSTVPSVTLTGLQSLTTYEVQVAAVCGTSTGAYSASTTFTTADLNYCAVAALDTTSEYIQNVTLANVNNTSANSAYTNYTTDPALAINLVTGNQYTLSVTKDWMDGGPYTDNVSAWIDYNRNGTFETNEQIMTSGSSAVVTVSQTFTVPTTAVTGLPLRMRVVVKYASTAGATNTTPCGAVGYGEIEDYRVNITNSLATAEVKDVESFSIYPNPTSDYLNVKNMKGKVTYTITNAAGQLVEKGMVAEDKVDVKSLTAGMYIITLESGSNKVSQKFIKK